MTEHTTILTDLDDDEIALLNDDAPEAAANEPDEPIVEDTQSDDEGVAGFEEAAPARTSEAEEALARRFGWKPKAEWKGDTTNHMEAGDYLERVIKPRLEDVPKVLELKDELAQVRRQAMQLQLEQQRAQEQQSTQTLEQIKAAQKRAFDLGDSKAYEETTSKLEEYYAARRPRQADPELQQRQQQANQDPAFLEWLPKNQDWYGANEAATLLAAQIAAEKLRNDNLTDVMQLPTWARKAFYEEIAQEVRARTGVGQQTAKQSTPKPPASEDASAARKPVQGAKKGWNSLPNDARHAFIKLSRMGIYPSDEKGKQEYARDYYRENPA